MRRIAIAAGVVLVALLVLGQLLLPPYLEHRVEQRLVKQGGSANVHLGAFPAERLLFGEGSSVRVHAHGIETPLEVPGPSALGKLDGFDHVDVRVTDMRTGPFDIASFALERRGGERPYEATLSATVTPADLSAFAGGTLGGQLGGFLGGLAAGALPFGTQPIPVVLDATVVSDGGRPVATSVNATIAGVPAGPLVEALAGALAGRF